MPQLISRSVCVGMARVIGVGCGALYIHSENSVSEYFFEEDESG